MYLAFANATKHLAWLVTSGLALSGGFSHGATQFTPGQRAFLLTEAAGTQNHVTQQVVRTFRHRFHDARTPFKWFNLVSLCHLFLSLSIKNISAVGTKQLWLHHNHCPYYVINRVISNKYGIKIIGKSYSTTLMSHTPSCNFKYWTIEKCCVFIDSHGIGFLAQSFVISSFNFRKCVFNFVPDPLECANARFNFVFGRSIFKHCHSISCFVSRFRQLLFRFVGHSSWARDSKIKFVYWHSFSSKFQSKSSPRCKSPITPDEFEWQNNDFVWKYDEFDPCIRNLLSDRDEFQWQLTNLNACILNLIDQKRIRMPIWRNWT